MNSTNLLEEVKQKKPLIFCITNYVTVNDCANIIISFGGSPIMSHEKSEVKELMKIADALYINIGTCRHADQGCIFLAIKEAVKKQCPIIFDPVACGASKFRRNISKKIIRKSFATSGVIKGNASEIMALIGSSTTKGVDANPNQKISFTEIKELVKLSNKTVCATGEIDYISDGSKDIIIENGVPELKSITGTGCMLGALIATFSAVTSNKFEAAKIATLVLDIAAEQAVKSSKDMTFKNNLFNVLTNINFETVELLKEIHEK